MRKFATEVQAPELLRVENVTVQFGGVRALDSVSFEVGSGEVLGLLGPNGAGKTTLFNSITGIYPVSSGAIYMGEAELSRMTPYRIAERGIARTFQNLAIFRGLTVVDHLLVGAHTRGSVGLCASGLGLPRAVRQERRLRAHAEDVLSFLGLGEFRKANMTDLAYGIQKRVELGRALVQMPRVLLLDEPTAGMRHEEKDEMVSLVRRIRDGIGCTVVVVEHDMRVVMSLVTRVVVFNFGRVMFVGSPDQAQNDRGVMEAYLGTRR